MDNIMPATPQNPPQATTPTQSTSQISPPTEPVQQNVIPEQPKSKTSKKKIILVVIVLMVLGLSSFLFVKSRQKKVSSSNITKTTYESNGATYTAYQVDDTERKDLTTPCYSSEVPKSAVFIPSTVAKDECSLQLSMPDTTLPFAKIIAINDAQGMTLKETAYSAKSTYEQLYKDAGNTKL